jgi:hypothetical protein
MGRVEEGLARLGEAMAGSLGAEAAAAVAGRRARNMGREPLEAAPCVELLTQAEVALGDGGRALARAAELADAGRRIACDAVLARGERAVAASRPRAPVPEARAG